MRANRGDSLDEPPRMTSKIDALSSSPTSREGQQDLFTRPQSPRQSGDIGKIILRAVSHGSPDELQSLFQRNYTNLEEIDEKGRTPLILAADLGKSDIVKRLLLEQSINVNATDRLGRTALHYCAQKKNTNNVVQLLLDRGADVNIQDRGFHPPMYYAISDGNYDTVKLLVDYRADIHFKLPKHPIPKRISSLLDSFNATGSTAPVTEAAQPKKIKRNSRGGSAEKRKSSLLRRWSTPDEFLLDQ